MADQVAPPAVLPQVVILAGGLGTRLMPYTETIPKALVPVQGRPFVELQLRQLRRQGIREVVLCLGHLAEQIQAYLGDGSRLGVQVTYSLEGETLLGTAGALKNAERMLHDPFFVMYGDSYLTVDFAQVLAHFQQFDKGALMVVYRNLDRYDRSNVVVGPSTSFQGRTGRMVKVYDKRRNPSAEGPGMEHIDYGLALLRKGCLALVPSGTPSSLEAMYQQLVEHGELLAFETQERFYEVGSPAGLEEFRRLVAEGKLSV
ncbi:MAG: nucleotidyltransferase family protein [Chloroflexi bacterium]|nr:nucleotidyltransferase family protein [Chloroflexota bacterium]